MNYESRCVRNTSAKRMMILLFTTAEVLALPTSTEPPSTVYPQYDDTLAMMYAKTILLIIDIHTNHGLKECCRP